MKNSKLIETILESDILDKIAVLCMSNSADLCVENIINIRQKIAEDGPKDFWLEDIEDNMISYRHLAYCYHYYTGEHLPIIEKRLK
jgi:hypothetical protein